MHPTIIQFGPVAIRSYGLMLAISFIIGLWFAGRRAKSQGINPDIFNNFSIFAIISSIVGARLFYVFFHFSEFNDPSRRNIFTRFGIILLRIISPFHSGGEFGISGLMFYGGLIVAIVVGVLYIHHHRINILKVCDIMAPSIALGAFFTRIGCFLNGCCFGKPTDSFWGMVFPDASPASYFFPGTAIYPTQIFSSLLGITAFVMLLFLERYKRFEGYTFTLFLMFLAFGRFVIDYFRFYTEIVTIRTIGLTLTINQVIGICIFLVSLIMFLLLYWKSRKLLVAADTEIEGHRPVQTSLNVDTQSSTEGR